MDAKGVILVFIYCGFIFTMFQVASVSSTEDHNDAAGRKLLGYDALFKAIGQSLKKFKGFKSGDDAAVAVTKNKDENYFENMIKQKCKSNSASCCETTTGNFTCARYCCVYNYSNKVSNVFEFTNGADPTSSTSSNGANSGNKGVDQNGSGLKNIASVYVLSSISLCYFIYYVLLLS